MCFTASLPGLFCSSEACVEAEDSLRSGKVDQYFGVRLALARLLFALFKQPRLLATTLPRCLYCNCCWLRSSTKQATGDGVESSLFPGVYRREYGEALVLYDDAGKKVGGQVPRCLSACCVR